jgi:subtilisin family serine protease
MFPPACIRGIALLGFVILLTPGWVNAGFPGQEKILDASLLGDVVKQIGTHRVIVTLRDHAPVKNLSLQSDPTRAMSVEARVTTSIEKALSGTGIQGSRISSRLKTQPIFSASISSGDIRSLAAQSDVAFIELNHEMALHTAQGIPQIQPGEYRTKPGGAGVAIAVVDSGVNYAHPALGGGGFPNAKVIGGYDFGDRDTDPMDTNGHGTACAAIAAGSPTGKGDFAGGVAPDAKIYALKIADSNGEMSQMGFLEAWDWCIRHQMDHPDYPIRIISTSLGAPLNSSSGYCQSPSAQAVAGQAVANGIAIFVSSGNEGLCREIAFPSCLQETIAVGAVYDTALEKPAGFCVLPKSCVAGAYSNDRCQTVCVDETQTQDQVCCYSNSAPILELLAPAHCTYTAGVPGGSYNTCFGGTSAACPYAAGAAALIQSQARAKTSQFLEPAELRKLMAQNGDPITDPKSGITKPRINIRRSIEAIGNRPNPAPVPVPVPTSGPSPPGTSAGHTPVDELRQMLRKSN